MTHGRRGETYQSTKTKFAYLYVAYEHGLQIAEFSNSPLHREPGYPYRPQVPWYQEIGRRVDNEPEHQERRNPPSRPGTRRPHRGDPDDGGDHRGPRAAGTSPAPARGRTRGPTTGHRPRTPRRACASRGGARTTETSATTTGDCPDDHRHLGQAISSGDDTGVLVRVPSLLGAVSSWFSRCARRVPCARCSWRTGGFRGGCGRPLRSARSRRPAQM